MSARHAAKTQFRLPSRAAQHRAALALAAALTLAVGAAFASPRPLAETLPLAAAEDDGGLTHAQAQVRYCQTLVDSSTAGTAARTRANQCLTDARRAVAWILAHPPTPTPTSSPTPAPTTPAPTTPAPTTPAPMPSPSPSPSTWPDETNTGVPSGTTLSVYTGPCRITTPGTIIDSKLVSCDLSVATTGVIVRNSSIGGTVAVEAPRTETTPRLTISDSVIDAGHRQVTGLGDGLFVATKLEVRGGNRGVLCAWRCTLQDSWIHGTWVESNWHASAVRAERYSTIVHNRLACDWLVPTALDGGCSADLTGYPDFTATHTWLIQGNLFVANPNGAAYCSYGGSSPSKPYSNDPLTGTNIVFRDNVYERGSNGRCAAYGPIDSFAAGKPGAEWTNNRYDDGTLVAP